MNMHSSEADGDKSRPNGFVVGEWDVAPARNLLVRGDERVRVEPRVMDVLVHLAEHADQPVSKEDVIERVWKGRYVTDDVLTVTIYALRKALGDDARRPRYIETVSRRGYRLIACNQAQPAEPKRASARAKAGGGHADIPGRRLRRQWLSRCSRRARCGCSLLRATAGTYRPPRRTRLT
jgi:DNA-binding winged helix-turn-helix (wHTH) protein